ncbi:MAG: diacylglycerol O-acyltransferase [Candidatus Azotimanducaceae bacterium]
MQKLTGIDASFLYMETDETPMHISSLLICEPKKEGENAFEALKAQIVERLHEIPSFHRKLFNTPFYIDHPVWVDADVVDLDYHIKHARLPEPGSVEQLRMVVQGLHSLTLDRDRPLWQFYIIEGIEDASFGLRKGSFALYTKAHHASLDGGAGASMMDIISDTKPTPRVPLPKNEIHLAHEEPGTFELLGSAFGKFIQQQVDFVTALPKYSSTFNNLVKSGFEDNEAFIKSLKPAPKTRFNVRIQKQRALGANSLMLKDVIAVAKTTGTSLNDVALSICGGALRRYLEGHNELPEASLVAMVPVSLRELGDKNAGNQVASMSCEIGTEYADPMERLKAVHENSKRSKKQMAVVKDVIPTDYSFFGAPIVVTAMAQLMGRTDIVNRMPPAFNVTISNVPGPRNPMYFAGSKVRTYFPVSIVTHGNALNITLQSYTDRLDFGLIACKIAVPDVQALADMINEDFACLQEAVAELVKQGELTVPVKKAAVKNPAKKANAA